MRKALAGVLAASLSFVALTPATAATGDLDLSFSGNGYALFSFPGSDYNSGSALLILPDKRIVAAGLAKDSSFVNRFGLLRTTMGGEPDQTFSGDGFKTDSFTNSDDSAIELLRQGERYIAAGWSQKGPSRKLVVARYNESGGLTKSFGNDGFRFVSLGPGETMVQNGAISDGRIVLAGYYEHEGNESIADAFVVRLKPDGALDDSFAGDGIFRFTQGASSGFDGMTVHPSGKIVAVGYNLKDGKKKAMVVRLTENGHLDDSFSGDGVARTVLGSAAGGTDVQIDDAGRYLVSGWVQTDVSMASLLRYRAAGPLDDNFSGDGKIVFQYDVGSNAVAEEIVIQPDDKIIVAGAQLTPKDEDSDLAAARFKTNGGFDGTFSGDGRTTIPISGWDYGSDAQLQGKRLIVAGGAGDSFMIAAIDTGL